MSVINEVKNKKPLPLLMLSSYWFPKEKSYSIRKKNQNNRPLKGKKKFLSFFHLRIQFKSRKARAFVQKGKERKESELVRVWGRESGTERNREKEMSKKLFTITDMNPKVTASCFT